MEKIIWGVVILFIFQINLKCTVQSGYFLPPSQSRSRSPSQYSPRFGSWLENISRSWMRNRRKSSSGQKFNPDLLNYFDSTYDESAAAMTMPELSPRWTQKYSEMKINGGGAGGRKNKFPNCGENYRNFDERCCWEEENYLRTQIKMEEAQGYIVHTGSFYWDARWQRCLISEPTPLSSQLLSMAVVVHGIGEKEQCDAERERQNSPCVWYTSSQRCHCLPSFMGQRKFRGHTYTMYKPRRRHNFIH